MLITYLGTTTLLFDDGVDQIMFDCHVTRPSLGRYLFGTLYTDPVVADRVIGQFRIDRLKGIFISHSHHDHVLDAPYFAKQCHANIYGSPSALNVARGGSISEDKLFSFQDQMEYEIGSFSISVLPSIHSKAHWYNDDLGQTIDTPLIQPAKKKAFKEGGSFDFYFTHHGKHYLIRPSYNFWEGQLDGIDTDVLFLGVGGLSRDSKERQNKFFYETLDRTHPQLVIPLHWDNFFLPLYGKIKELPRIAENTEKSLSLLKDACVARNIRYIVQQPLTGLDM